MSSGPELPSGTVTFLFTDIEGSTRLLKQLRDGYARVLAEHQKLLRAAFAAHGGQVVDTQGDAFFVVFRRAKDAVGAAAAAQRALVAHAWPVGAEVRVRMGVHTGQAEATDGQYHGLAVHRASRIGDAAHGGQVLVSQTARDLLDDEEEESEGIELRDLGEQRLKDLDRPVRLYQLDVEGLPGEFPPLRTVAPAGVEPAATKGAGRWRRLRVAAPLAALIVGGAVAAGVLLTRGSGGAALAAGGVAADSVGVFDAGSGKLIAEAPVRSGPSAVAAGAGSIWVTNTNGDSVSRIDLKTNASVDTIPVGNAPSGIAVGGGFVWVANSLDGSVWRIDPQTNGVVQKIQVGKQPVGVAYGEGSVWVANETDRTVMQIDPRSGAVRKTIPVDGGTDAIAVGGGEVWVASQTAGSVARIDPRTAGVVLTINVGNGPSAIAAGAGSIWTTNSLDDTVSRIDLGSDKVQATIHVGAGPSAVAIGSGGRIVWVSNEQGGTLSRIDPRENTVVQTVPTGNRPRGLAFGGSTVYAAVRTTGLAHRGGTLTVARGPGFGSAADHFDPAVVYDTGGWQILLLTNDGLVTYKRAGGSEGTQLVPDLATTLPTPTDGGRTYRFQLRRIRYSTGAPVRPADFRRAIERALLGNGAGSYFAGIVGANSCTKKSCDLSKGIVADPASNTVTFHLIAPDAEFLFKLALPTADAVPADTPLEARLPLPATGPYMVKSFRAEGSVRLVRNPRFHEWSAAAQPNGYPDEIVIKDGYSSVAAVRAVAQGNADFTPVGGDLSATRRAALRTRYAAQLHENATLSTLAVYLNTRVPPFNDVRVRRAFSYAIDRNKLVELRGGADLSQTTCQVLPPNVAGYHRRCPYTSQPSLDGTYAGPDLTKARRLIAASGTKGQTVTFHGGKGFIDKNPATPYFLSVLRTLGYKTRLVLVSPKKFPALYGDARSRWQAIPFGWVADYPAASAFFLPVLTCASFKPASRGGNQNFSEFCDRRVDAEIARAVSLHATDPQAAALVWAKVDRDIVDQAPWVPYANPRTVEFVSRRVGNYVYSLFLSSALLDQLWVR